MLIDAVLGCRHRAGVSNGSRQSSFVNSRRRQHSDASGMSATWRGSRSRKPQACGAECMEAAGAVARTDVPHLSRAVGLCRVCVGRRATNCAGAVTRTSSSWISSSYPARPGDPCRTSQDKTKWKVFGKVESVLNEIIKGFLANSKGQGFHNRITGVVMQHTLHLTDAIMVARRKCHAVS